MILPVIIVAGAAVALWKIHGETQRKQIADAWKRMDKVLRTRKDDPGAMYREEIGVIGFRYGAHYPAKNYSAKKKRKRSGHGLAHVVGSAKEDYGKYEGSPTPEEILRIIPEVILDGEIKLAHSNRIIIEHKGHRVLLSKAGKRKDDPNWVFHAYKLYPKKTA